MFRLEIHPASGGKAAEDFADELANAIESYTNVNHSVDGRTRVIRSTRCL